MKNELNHPTKPVAERDKRTPFAQASRAVASMLVEDLKLAPGDTVAVAITKTLALAALAGRVDAASALTARAEGRPAQAIVQQSDESSIAALGPELFAASVRIIMARCEAFNLPVPDFLIEAKRMIESGELEPPADRMKQRDGFGVSLECGHPNERPGARCRLCGREVPRNDQHKENQADERTLQQGD
jgi:hypothetical protein